MSIQTSGEPMENQLMTMTETAAAATDPALVYLAGLSTSGRRSMKQRLELVANLAGERGVTDWTSMRYEHVVAIRTALQEQAQLSPASVNATLCALRGVAREAWKLC